MEKMSLFGLAVLFCFVGGVPSDFRAAEAPAASVGDARSQPEMPSWAKVSKEQIAGAGKLGIPVAFSNAIGMKFVLAPAGEFMMGSPEDEQDRYPVEGPRHKVTFAKPFYISIHQTTQGNWEAVMGTRPWDGKRQTKNNPDNAVNHVNCEDARRFCAKLSEKDGGTYRLTTEAEWEYACRAGTTTRFWYGDDLKGEKLKDFAWFIGNIWDRNPKSERYVHKVGLKKPNPWGLYDMHGNVWEMCMDVWRENYKGAPTDGSAWEGDGTEKGQSGLKYPLRGGGLRSTAIRCRSASRYPRSRKLEGCYYVGFRVSCVVRPKKAQ